MSDTDGAYITARNAAVISGVNTGGPLIGVAVAGSGYPTAGAAVAGGSVLVSIGLGYWRSPSRGSWEASYEEDAYTEVGQEYDETRQENMTGVITFLEEHAPDELAESYKEQWTGFLED